MAMKSLSLFAGIGGFDIGLERAGFRTVAQCEIDPFARAALSAAIGEDIGGGRG